MKSFYSLSLKHTHILEEERERETGVEKVRVREEIDTFEKG